MQRFVRRLISLPLALAVVACFGCAGEAPRDTGLLSGDRAAPALTALTNKMPKPAASSDIVNGLILTRLDVAIATGATVGLINAALGVVGGTIDAMRIGLPAVTVAVPRQATAEAMQALANTLRAQPGIRAGPLGRSAGRDVAAPAQANADSSMSHLQTATFPAAWKRQGGRRCVHRQGDRHRCRYLPSTVRAEREI